MGIDMHTDTVSVNMDYPLLRLKLLCITGLFHRNKFILKEVMKK
ncbi:hypothetical protein PSYMO_34534 [Pseudomonas amygdali pv. mori str. 301020]|uniref:Uncharacterized protein n=1 Tax=Pseudomonas amygdali pv. mori str. 301020 TaxID=629261 RepID=A0A656GL81_PSEA0|nr:hypothetical protein PSYMO_34232 [Pseudomonas amygdali pv. mori str. 301020]EGH26281.1 hypothetical protein PSYMO_34534 [Pseudomonas amygdali pv. mori str. 301020]